MSSSLRAFPCRPWDLEPTKTKEMVMDCVCVVRRVSLSEIGAKNSPPRCGPLLLLGPFLLPGRPPSGRPPRCLFTPPPWLRAPPPPLPPPRATSPPGLLQGWCVFGELGARPCPCPLHCQAAHRCIQRCVNNHRPVASPATAFRHVRREGSFSRDGNPRACSFQTARFRTPNQHLKMLMMIS